MRFLAPLLAVLALASDAYALTGSKQTAVFSAAPTLQVSAPIPLGSAKFPDDNGLNGGTTVTALSLPAGAMTPPRHDGTTNDALGSFVVVAHVKYDDSARAWNSNTPVATTTVLAKCSAGCGSGNDTYLQISNPSSSGTIFNQNSEITLAGKVGGFGPFWTPNAAVTAGGIHTAITLNQGAAACIVQSQMGIDSAYAGLMVISALDANGNLIGQTANNYAGSGTGNMSTASNGYYYSAANTPRLQSGVGDIYSFVGAQNTTTTPSRGLGGSVGPVAMLYGIAPNSGGTPTLAFLQSVCGPKLAANAAAAGLTVHFLAQLNDIGTYGYSTTALGSNPVVSASITATGTITAGPPILPSPALTVVDPGTGYVHAAYQGQTGSSAQGSVWIKGSYNTAALGGTPKFIEAQITTGAYGTGSIAGPWARIAIPAAGAFYGQYPGITVGGPYYVCVRASNARKFVSCTGSGQYVGLVVGVVGQSEKSIMDVPCAQGGTTCTGYQLTYGSETMISVMHMNSGTAPIGEQFPHGYVRQLTVANMPGGISTQQTGDGLFRMLKDLDTRSGHWPIMAVMMAKTAQPAEAWAYDYLTFTKTTTLTSGTTYGATLSVTTADSNPIPGGTFYSITQTAVPNTIKVFVSGTQIGQDDGAGNITGTGITSGTVNYLTRVASVTFASTPAAAPTIQWTHVMDVTGGGTIQRSPALYFGVMGSPALSPSTGLTNQIESRLLGPLSVLLFGQCNANSGEVGSVTGLGNYTGWETRWNYTFKTRFPAYQAWNNTPIGVLGYERDSGSSFASANGCQAALQQFATDNGYPFLGSYADGVNDSISSPHENPNVLGGQRYGRRWAAEVWSLQSTGAPTPQGTITGCSGRGTATITCIVALPTGATSIATCGTNLSSLTCTTTLTGIMRGMRFGASNTVMYDQDGDDQANLVVDATKAFSCAIATATTFTCTYATGSFPATVYWSYMAGQPMDRWGTLIGVSGAAGSACTTANGTVNVTMTGGTAATKPVIAFTIAANSITGAAVVNAGHAVTVNPTVAFPPGCTSTALTTTFGALADEENYLGTSLYTNEGGFSTFEPGMPVMPTPTPTLVN